MKNIPILSFVSRYWLLLVLSASFAWTARAHWSWTLFHSLVYPPVLVTLSMVLALLVRHCFYRKTIDQDSHTRRFIVDWDAMTSEERVRYSILLTSVLYLGACIISASVWK